MGSRRDRVIIFLPKEAAPLRSEADWAKQLGASAEQVQSQVSWLLVANDRIQAGAITVRLKSRKLANHPPEPIRVAFSQWPVWGHEHAFRTAMTVA